MNKAAIQRIDTAFDDGLPKAIFDHLRNFLMCAFLLAIGTTEFHTHKVTTLGLLPAWFSGVGIIAVASLLFLLNLVDGIRRLARLKFQLLLSIGLIAIYVLFAIRVVEIAWNFRAN